MTVSTFRWIVGVIIVAAVAFGVGWRLNDGGSDADATPTPTAAVVPTPERTGTRAPSDARNHRIELTAAGLSIRALTIATGDTVTFVNATDGSFWPASDPHPNHTQCPGFDARRVLRKGESYTLQFTVPQVCGFHDHTAPSTADRFGTITVR